MCLSLEWQEQQVQRPWPTALKEGSRVNTGLAWPCGTHSQSGGHLPRSPELWFICCAGAQVRVRGMREEMVGPEM